MALGQQVIGFNILDILVIVVDFDILDILVIVVGFDILDILVIVVGFDAPVPGRMLSTTTLPTPHRVYLLHMLRMVRAACSMFVGVVASHDRDETRSPAPRIDATAY